MKIWALADLHLSLGVPSKSMEVFGPNWTSYQEKMHASLSRCLAQEDLLLLAGDISWALHLDEVLVDLEWIDAFPGTKLLLKGNHDHWWPSSAKLKKLLPPSIHFIYNNAFDFGEVTIGGTRLWESSEYSYEGSIQMQDNPRARHQTEEQLLHQKEEDKKIFARELERLKLSLKQLNPKAKWRIAMTHYPPIGPDLAPSAASAILEANKIDICLFGHMHNVKKGSLELGSARGVRYLFTAADYLNFEPRLVYNSSTS